LGPFSVLAPPFIIFYVAYSIITEYETSGTKMLDFLILDQEVQKSLCNTEIVNIF